MITVLNLNILIPLLMLAGSSGAAVEEVWVERQTYLMGTVLRARVAAPSRDAGIEAIEAVFAEVARLEGVLSSWTESSDLERVNRAKLGEPLSLGEELADLLWEAFGWRGATGGAFEPAIGALVDVWDARGAGREPTAAELAQALAATGPGVIELRHGVGAVVRWEAAAWIDSGGFGKGAALRAASRTLRSRGISEAVVDFGGQLLLLGGAPDGTAGGHEIVLSHPSARSRTIGWLKLRAGSIATSGQSERYVEIGGERFGHILDPRTGLPVSPWGSVTVIAEDPLVADVVATALYVMGPEAGGRWARLRSDVAVLFVDHSAGEIRATWNPAFERFEFHISKGR